MPLKKRGSKKTPPGPPTPDGGASSADGAADHGNNERDGAPQSSDNHGNTAPTVTRQDTTDPTQEQQHAREAEDEAEEQQDDETRQNQEREHLLASPLDSQRQPPAEEERRSNQNIAMMVRVRAPATLPAGFTFAAQVNEDPSKTFTCQVPEGGMEEGTLFWTPLPIDFPDDRLQAPFGRWKDGICDCFWSLGCCHPHVWCSLFCPALQMAQIMTRMQLTCFGRPGGPPQNTRNTFYIVTGVVGLYVLVSTTLSLAESYYIHKEEVPGTATIISAPLLSILVSKTVASLLYTCWLVYALCRTRQSVRTQYGIPASSNTACGRDGRGECWEDFCCSLLCTCCTVAQLARHTGDYETHPSVCCTETGHPPSAPLLV